MKSVSIRTFFKKLLFVGVLFVLFILPGCLGKNGPNNKTSQVATITGKVAFPVGSQLVIQSLEGRNHEAMIKPDSTFSAEVPPGTYNILLQASDGSLQLIKKSVFIQDFMLVNFLDVDLVPIPRIISISVPVIYSDSAVVEWQTDIPSDGRVDYGRDQTYEFSTFTETELTKSHRIQLLSLNPSSTYHFRVVASRHGIETVKNLSNDYAFITNPE